MQKPQEELDQALCDAAREGDVERARELIQNGADVNATTTYGWTALVSAARNGHMNVVRFLIERGADVNAKTTDGWTPLIQAAENNQASVVRYLVVNERQPAQGTQVARQPFVSPQEKVTKKSCVFWHRARRLHNDNSADARLVSLRQVSPTNPAKPSPLSRSS